MRSVTGKPLRVDANEGWKDKETAIRRLEWLATKGVELVEQPMPAALVEEQAWLKARSPLPLFADESCLRATDIPKIAAAYHGVNVKVDKAGGLREALRMIHVARACGLQRLTQKPTEAVLGERIRVAGGHALQREGSREVVGAAARHGLEAPVGPRYEVDQ